MTYNGLFTVTEGKIPFITKKGFSMIYKEKADTDGILERASHQAEYIAKGMLENSNKEQIICTEP